MLGHVSRLLETVRLGTTNRHVDSSSRLMGIIAAATTGPEGAIRIFDRWQEVVFLRILHRRQQIVFLRIL